MAHVRTQLRNALVTLLTGLASTADRVYGARLTPLDADELPALRVFVDEEALELGTVTSPMQLERTALVRVEGLAKAADGLDDELDQLAAEIETAIAADDTLGGLLNEPMRLTAIEIERTLEADRAHGRIVLVYAARYDTAAGAPEVSL